MTIFARTCTHHLLVAAISASLAASGALAQTNKATAGQHSAQAAKPLAGTYKIDLAHSHAYFVISHLGISRFMGRFDDIQGEFVVGDRPDKSTVKASIRVDSINAKHQKLEEHLRSADFFETSRFPTMEFVSSQVNWNARGEGKLSGNLTIHGVTKPVEFALKVTGAGVGLREEVRSGFEATTTLKRSDFGMKYGLPNIVGDAVEITLSVEGVRQ